MLRINKNTIVHVILLIALMTGLTLFSATEVMAQTPTAPTNLIIVVIDSRQVGLKWVDNTDNEDGYWIKRADDAAFTINEATFWVRPDVTSYIDRNLIPGITYYYRVRAYIDTHLSRYIEASVTTPVSDNASGAPPSTTDSGAPTVSFDISGLDINPKTASPGTTLNISAMVINKGGASGQYIVVLSINNAQEAEEQITLTAGASQRISFTTSRDVPATYTVSLNGLGGSFVITEKTVTSQPDSAVQQPTPPSSPEALNRGWVTFTAIVAASVVIGTVIFVMFRRKRIS